MLTLTKIDYICKQVVYKELVQPVLEVLPEIHRGQEICYLIDYIFDQKHSHPL